MSQSGQEIFIMILYHGSNVIVDHPLILKNQRLLDFGPGFYTTTNKKQAEEFSVKVYKRRKKGTATLNIYELVESEAYQQCTLLHFKSPDEAWLDFVTNNRAGRCMKKQYDLIIGPVANDNVYRTINLYTSKEINKIHALERLKINKLFDQFVFTSEKSLNFLKFIGYYVL